MWTGLYRNLELPGELDICGAEQLVHQIGPGQMMSPRSFGLHLGLMASEAHRTKLLAPKAEHTIW
jgi:hypothetical protein